MKIVLGFRPSYSAQVLGKLVHEPFSFPLAETQSTTPVEVTLLGPHEFSEGTGPGRACKCRCWLENQVALDLALRWGWGKALLAEDGLMASCQLSAS